MYITVGVSLVNCLYNYMEKKKIINYYHFNDAKNIA